MIRTLQGAVLARRVEHFRQTDVTMWGIVAVAIGALAILSANLSALIPPSIVTGLHATRLEGGNLNYLRNEVAQLRAEATRMRIENGRMETILSIAEQDRGDVVRRLGAIEENLPSIVATGILGGNIDSRAITGGIEDGDGPLTPVEGGAVSVRERSMFEQNPNLSTTGEEPDEPTTESLPLLPLPATNETPLVRISSDGYGIAIGHEVSRAEAADAWSTIRNRAGPLILGLQPILGGEAVTGKSRIVVGPLQNFSSASDICSRLSEMGIGCLPVEYSGVAMPQ